MAQSAGSPGDRLHNWKLSHWPPKGMKKCGELPIYIGDHEAVTAFALSLRPVSENCGTDDGCVLS